jgi:NAD(P)-dependent dehydrogenase (short-subunit alcohol dehydrogenase family)
LGHFADVLGLEGKAALVVGGGRGMGESSARYLAEAGCDVAIADIDADRAKRVADMVAGMGRRSVAIVGDVLEDGQAAAMVETARQALGRLDRLVTIVGQALFKPTLEITPEDWDFDHARNLRYAFFVAQAFAKPLIAEGKTGAMVCICSVSGLQAAVQHVAYGAAKAGLINIVRTLGVEWAPYGIRVNGVAPGSIITPRIPDTPEREQQTRNSLIPMRRRGRTDEIGRAVLFLCSDLASYVTGHALPVDGGWMAANILLPNQPRD